MIADPGQAAWLHQGPAAALLSLLSREGDEARVVGGAVRNALFGETPGDIDIATTALPDEVMRRVQAAGHKAVPTGIEHGTVTVVIGNTPFEVTTLREDVETFGRKAVVKFGRDWKADAERRDFTINALSLSADGRVHDYVGGLADIAARRVRFIGNPAARIAEDYLRILRFFRFHATYGHGEPDTAGLHAAIVARASLAKLSRERVRMELLKLMLAPRAAATLTLMSETGILVTVLAGVPLVASFERLAAAEAAGGYAPCAIRRLGALNVVVPEDAERLWERLRLTNAEHKRLQVIADRWWRVAPGQGDAWARALLYRTGPEGFADRVLVAWSRAGSAAAEPAWRELAELPRRWTAPAFPLSAADFIARGVAAGPQLGAALRAAEDSWIAEDFTAELESLRRIADAAAHAQRRGAAGCT